MRERCENAQSMSDNPVSQDISSARIFLPGIFFPTYNYTLIIIDVLYRTRGYSMTPLSCEAPVLCACAVTITRQEAALIEFQRMASLTEERFKQLVEYPIPRPPESSEIRFLKTLI